MAKKQPRYLLCIWKDGTKHYFQKLDQRHDHLRINHTLNYWEAQQFTRFKADQVAGDISSNLGQYDVEPCDNSKL